MTHHETPDPLGFPVDDPTGVFGTESTPTPPAMTSQVDAAVISAEFARPFPTRRELRLRREAQEREAQDAAAVVEAGPVPQIPVAPVAVVVETRAEPEVLAPRAARRSRTESTRESARPPKSSRVRTAPDTARSRTLRQRITGTATMVLVGGIFASLTLPAYASPVQGGRASVAVDTATQKLDVRADVAPAAARDGYGATSFTDLRAAYAAQIRQANGKNYLISAARALGDDYPWYDQLTDNQGGGLSPLRYNYRECVDFVAWRLNVDAGTTSPPYRWDWSTLTPGGGNGRDWPAAWRAKGWATGGAPQVGGVAAFPSGNHVAYVSAVYPDGSVMLEEYNWNTDHMYGQRIVPASTVPLFLAPPPR